MAEVSRTARSARNALVGGLTQVLLILLTFVTRTIFLTSLGVELLGVQTLLVSVLALLAVADLGINGAVMYALYEPLQSGDEVKVASVVRYAQRLYRWVATAVALVGLAFTPFLPLLVSQDVRGHHLELYFIVLLVDSVAAYLMIHRRLLLEADQRGYVVKIWNFAFTAARSVFQIIVLLMFQSFLGFLVLQALFTIVANLTLYRRAGRLYPRLSDGAALPAVERQEINHGVRAMLVYRVGGLLLHNSTPVLVSVLVGTVALGYYSNYMLVVGSVLMLTEVVFAALTPSVGHLVTSSDGHRSRQVFDEIFILSMAIYGALSVVMLLLLDDFVGLWLGDNYRLGGWVAFFLVLNFFVTGIMTPVWAFRSATGMFRRTRYVILVTAGLNVALAAVLGSLFGLAGLAAAPVAARLLTVVWYEPWILFRHYVQGGVASYVVMTAVATATLAVAYGASWALTQRTGTGATAFVMDAVVVLIVTGTALGLTIRLTSPGRRLEARFRNLIAGH